MILKNTGDKTEIRCATYRVAGGDVFVPMTDLAYTLGIERMGMYSHKFYIDPMTDLAYTLGIERTGTYAHKFYIENTGELCVEFTPGSMTANANGTEIPMPASVEDTKGIPLVPAKLVASLFEWQVKDSENCLEFYR